MKTAILFCSAALAVTLPAMARADDGRVGFSSEATATVTVVIPPIAAGIEATQDGAVGLWSLTSDTGGLLVKVPDTVAAGQSSALDVFRTDGNVFNVSVPDKTGFHLTSTTETENKGLTRQSFTLSNMAPSADDSLQVLITGV